MTVPRLRVGVHKLKKTSGQYNECTLSTMTPEQKPVTPEIIQAELDLVARQRKEVIVGVINTFIRKGSTSSMFNSTWAMYISIGELFRELFQTPDKIPRNGVERVREVFAEYFESSWKIMFIDPHQICTAVPIGFIIGRSDQGIQARFDRLEMHYRQVKMS